MCKVTVYCEMFKLITILWNIIFVKTDYNMEQREYYTLWIINTCSKHKENYFYQSFRKTVYNYNPILIHAS